MLSFCWLTAYNALMQRLSTTVEALMDDIEELLALGDAYRYGSELIKVDFALAESYYRVAAELGDWEGMRLLAAVLEEQGRCAEAVRWLERAAGEGDEKAEAELRCRG